jgi:hypothetical protein
LNPELANPYVLPVFNAIGPYLLPLVTIFAIAFLATRFIGPQRWAGVARAALILSLILVGLYLAMCLRLYPK